MRAAHEFCLVSMTVSVSSKAGVRVEWAAERGLPRQRLRGIDPCRKMVYPELERCHQCICFGVCIFLTFCFA